MEVEMNRLSAKAFVVGDGVRIETDILGSITVQFINLRAQMQEKAVRDWLIANGWTPPTEEPTP